jgi:hypothetical protein
MLDHFEKTAHYCSVLGPRFYIAFKEANANYIHLYSVCVSRGIKQ